MEIRTEFDSPEDFRSYLLETGAVYEEDGVHFMDVDKCREFAPDFFRDTMQTLYDSMAPKIADGTIGVTYDPVIEDGDVKMNPTYHVPEDIDLRN